MTVTGWPQWPTWQPQTLADAQNNERLLCVFVLDEGDHWSAQQLAAVQADADVVDVLETVFQPVLCWRRAQPALARRVQEVLALTAGGQGWPAIAFALPNGDFVAALPYTPVRDADKRVGLARILVDCAEAWIQNREHLTADAAQLAALLTQLNQRPETTLPQAELLFGRLEAEAMELADSLEGGFGPPPRQHSPALMDFLLTRCADSTAAPALRKQVQKTLDAWLTGGMHDHLAGGFFHASADAHHALPNFQKLLADNAQLVCLLLRAADILERPVYRQAAVGAMVWCCEALRDERGVFQRGLHADSLDESGAVLDGAAYAWSQAAAAAVVGQEQAALFARRYLADEHSRRGDSDWFHPTLRGAVSAAEQEQLPSLCRRLLMARLERPQPALLGAADCREMALTLQALAALRKHEPEEALWSEVGEQLRQQLQVDGDDPQTAVFVLAAQLAWDGPQQSLLEQALQVWEHWQAGGADDALVPGAQCDTDLPDGHAPVAVLAQLAVDLQAWDASWSQRAQQLLRQASSVIQAAPMTVAGLCAVWSRLGTAEKKP